MSSMRNNCDSSEESDIEDMDDNYNISEKKNKKSENVTVIIPRHMLPGSQVTEMAKPWQS